MPYLPLQKLFYMDATTNRFEANARMAKTRLEAESTFRTDIAGKDGEFFLAVPRELSPDGEGPTTRKAHLAAF